MSSSISYKYGILVRNRETADGRMWKICIIETVTSEVSDINVYEEMFDFETKSPELGDTVKVGFRQRGSSEEIVVVKQCFEERERRVPQWLRDVEIRDGNVVIYCFVTISKDDMNALFFRAENQTQYYVLTDEQSDIRDIAIERGTLDDLLTTRRAEQKENENVVYRMGVFYHPIRFTKHTKVRWKHYRNSPSVPIFEHYLRDLTVPYIAPSLVYGCIDGLVISISDAGALFWSHQMGCAIMSSVTTSKLPSLGEQHVYLTKRSLVEKSFGFDCFYELMPVTRQITWDDVRVVPDRLTNKLYVELTATCTKDQENDELMLYHWRLGYMRRGIERFEKRLTEGTNYVIRLEFEQLSAGSQYQPVVKDVVMGDELQLVCRIVYVSAKEHACFAVIDAEQNKIPDIGFIYISERVLWCSSFAKRLNDKELLMSLVLLRVQKGNNESEFCECVDVHGIKLKPLKNSILRRFHEFTWLRTKADVVECSKNGPIYLRCVETGYPIVDQLRKSTNFVDLRSIAVNCKCVLKPNGVPIFLLYHVATSFPNLAHFNSSFLDAVPTVQEVFKDVSSVEKTYLTESRKIEDDVSECSNRLKTLSIEENYDLVPNTHDAIERGRNMTVDHRDEYSIIPVEPSSMEILIDSSDLPTILDQEEYDKRNPMMDLISPSTTTPIIEKSPSIFSPKKLRPEKKKRLTIFGKTVPGKSGRPERRFGIRQYHGNMYDASEFLSEVVYHHLNSRPVLPKDERAVENGWRQGINAVGARAIAALKHKIVSVIGIEWLDREEFFKTNRCEYQSLVRFYVSTQDITVMDRFVVIPVGGKYPTLPTDFQLGLMYKVALIYSPSDRLVRVGGFGKGTGPVDFYPALEVNPFELHLVINDRKGRQWLRIKKNCNRPCPAKVVNEKFEIWDSSDFGGLMIIETKGLNLEEMNPEMYTSYLYKCILEPIAGGPVSVRELVNKDAFFDHSDYLILWRIITSFNYPDVDDPTLLERYEKEKPRKPQKVTPSVRTPGGPSLAGMCRILQLSEEAQEEKFDRLYALKDHRVIEAVGFEGKALSERASEFSDRRHKLKNALEGVSRNLVTLNKYGMYLGGEDILERYLTNKSFNKEKLVFHDFEKITVILQNGCEFLMKPLLDHNILRMMHRAWGLEMYNLLLVIADCLAFNYSYVRKSEHTITFFKYCQRYHLHEDYD